MASPKSSMITRLVQVGTILAVLTAVLVWPAAWVLERGAVRVQYVSPFDEATVRVNRWTYEQAPTGREADIIAIYGSPSGDPETIVFANDSRFLHPAEQPELVLYAKQSDENPLQLQSVFFLARALSIGAAATGFLLALLLVFLRRRRGAGLTPARL